MKIGKKRVPLIIVVRKSNLANVESDSCTESKDLNSQRKSKSFSLESKD